MATLFNPGFLVKPLKYLSFSFSLHRAET